MLFLFFAIFTGKEKQFILIFKETHFSEHVDVLRKAVRMCKQNNKHRAILCNLCEVAWLSHTWHIFRERTCLCLLSPFFYADLTGLKWEGSPSSSPGDDSLLPFPPFPFFNSPNTTSILYSHMRLIKIFCSLVCNCKCKESINYISALWLFLIWLQILNQNMLIWL